MTDASGTIILVEGDSDRIAVETLAARLGVDLPPVVPIGGSKNAPRAIAAHPATRLIGLVDAGERRDFESVIDTVFVCDPDLEAEFVRALGIDGTLEVVREQGELDSFRKLQRQPALRERPIQVQLARFFGGRSGNKLRYARLLAEAVPFDRVPAPLAALFDAATA
ncbi:ATP-dependent endonuclease [Agromyces intestinalis]|uniref:ATP-dependent endonuclease n=1 Tax=Agromyces intestinalis TaxID=2592652 RepID=A0A5C1YJS3_9MICO|nr:ATP-dependent endonuclease [Agromyces intestinalis]QEO15510.1 ATP-dependent endonuclease [Agromyces intestinalis]